MAPFGITAPARILFGRGESAKAPALITAFGTRGVLVHGANPARAQWLLTALQDLGAEVLPLPCPREPDLAMLNAAVAQAKGAGAEWVVGLGGGAALDLAKAVAALLPAPGGAMDHLEVVGRALPLAAPPLPFIAIPTTAGTGAEATKNAVIGLPEHHRKVSLRDDRMLARLAIIDPALTDHCPRAVTLASGLDALTQVIEPYVSCRATPFTDALTLPAIGSGLTALIRLMQVEDPEARDALAWVSLCGGLALANAGLGAVHGLAGVIGGSTGAAHGAICGALLAPVLSANLAATSPGSPAHARLTTVCSLIGTAFGTTPEAAPTALATWIRAAGLPGLTAQGLSPADHAATTLAAQASSSMQGNPVPLSPATLQQVLAAAS
ncbi:iron-containing alcohol dehydrogenase [Rhodobacter ferrooxidans]|uniref:iron-containing alcohol dehydrogenase n=1 Tax=Rhodobacter ferrooxidans TaxID=371731 RepID=UPI0009FF70AD|nr:iron-containing alcohol dehydrogenase [Rhodobacter sp. SW2]